MTTAATDATDATNAATTSTTTTPETPPSGTVDGPGGGDWRAALPEDLRSDPLFKDVKDLPSLAKGYLHAQKAIGNNVAIPAKDASPEDWGAFFNKVGRPETADKYDFSKVEVPEGVTIDEDLQKAYLAKAHELGLSQRQAAGLFGWQAGLSAEHLASAQQARQEGMAAAEATLKKEFGAAYTERIAAAKQAVLEFGGPEMLEMLDASGMGNDPGVVKMFAKIGQAMQNDELFGAGQATGAGNSSPAEAQDEINRLMGDPEFSRAYFDGENPGHAAAVERMRKLFQQANPETA